MCSVYRAPEQPAVQFLALPANRDAFLLLSLPDKVYNPPSVPPIAQGVAVAESSQSGVRLSELFICLAFFPALLLESK